MQPNPSNPVDELSLRDLVTFARRCWKWIVLTVSITAIIVVYKHHAEPAYQARALILVQGSNSSLLLSITSRMSGNAVGDTGLDHLDKYLPYLHSQTLFRHVAAKVQKSPDYELIRIHLGLAPLAGDQSSSVKGQEDLERLSAAILESASADKDGPDVLRITSTNSSRSTAVYLANVIAETAVDDFTNLDLRELEEAKTFFESQLQDVDKRVQRINAATLKIVQQQGGTSATSLENEAGGYMSEMKHELAAAELKLGENRAVLANLLSRTETAALGQEVNANDPVNFGAEARIRKFKLEAQILEARIKSIHSLIKEQQSAHTDVPRAEQALQQLKRQADVAYASFADFNHELMGIEVQRISIRNKVRMFETASQVRSERSTRFGPKMGIASIIVALMTGFLYYLYELVFPLVRFRSDLDNLPMLLLGAIPSVNRHRKGLVGLKADLIRKLKGWKSKAPLETLLLNFESDSFEAMAFKYVRTRIVNLNKHSKRVVIAVISGRSGEGKTFVAANLASAIARMGHRTILVDTDLRNPNLSRSYKMTNEMGLVDVLGELSDQGENSNLVRKIGPNLHILPAGKYRVDATERLSGDAFKELLAVLRLHYEYIILDTPPILSTAEALAMTIVADQICITITPGESRIDDVQRVLEKLVQTGSTNIGYVLNRSKAGLTPYIYPTEAKAVATDPSSRAS